MGKKYNVPMQEISNSGAHEIQVPLHMTCPSNPKYNKSVSLRVMYGADIYLYDLLKQVEQYISISSKEHDMNFEIGAISAKSFINRTVVLNDLSTMKCSIQYDSITNYKEKDIIRKGVHIMMNIKGNTFNEGDLDDEVRRPLQTLSMNENNSNHNNYPHKLKIERTLDERLKELYDSSDVAYCNFDDIMYNFRKKEDSLYSSIDENYVKNKQTSITWNMRSVLLDWLYDLQLDLRLNEETLFASIHYIDLFLSKSVISRQQLQLLGVTAICIASKTYEIIPQSINEWIYLSHDQYTRRQIVNLEKKVLKLINWNVFQVTPYNYIKPWLEILEITNDSKEKFIIDFLIQSVSLNKIYLEIKLSKLIAAVIYLTNVYLKSKFSIKLLSQITQHNVVQSKSINNIIVQLNQNIINLIKKGGKDSMTSAIFRKFTNKKYIQRTYNGLNFDIKTFQFNRIFNQFERKI